VVQENSGGTLTNLLHGPGTDNLLQRGSNWFVPASLNSTSTVVDGTGAVLQRYYYQPFGQLSMQGGGSPQPYQFTGREADESGLMFYRARSPTARRQPHPTAHHPLALSFLPSSRGL
jgi:hypothetical protein